MALDNKLWQKQLKEFPEVDDCIRQSKNGLDALPSYKYLYQSKVKIPKELYAYYLRKLLKFNTGNVPWCFRLKMLEGVNQNDIMYSNELESIQHFDDSIIVYRGASKKESKPGISWSLRRYIADSEDYNKGRLFIATISKTDIIIYMSREDDEEEIIAHVTENYEIIDS